MSAPPDDKPRILVVDDELSVRVLLTSILSRAGYVVSTYENAESALAELAAQQPQLVIVDRVLPGMDGIDFFRLARAQLPKLQGILISGYPSEGIMARALDAGLKEYVVKPFQVSDVLTVCEAVMKMAPSSTPGE
ncbi:MAG: response regulator [Myxococcota bacterium]|nr:response regulator [Myxococcota bacterium]